MPRAVRHFACLYLDTGIFVSNVAENFTAVVSRILTNYLPLFQKQGMLISQF